MRLTKKQLQILKVIKMGNDDGSAVDIDQVIERLNYKTTKESFQFSARALIKRGMITKLEREKRRGRTRCVYSLTKMGYDVLEHVV